ncbi:unnamed protein product [Polarella glacialis]|uniref:PDZ domain-containing protein n=1 Tax=Polarella glacialis TaxID=89957 RepID=A0A813GV16_POLGL|nr:unnamed protein product [Polarella glacialis]
MAVASSPGATSSSEVALRAQANQHKLSIIQAVIEASPGAEEPLTFSLVINKTPGSSLGIDVTYSSATSWLRNGVFIARLFEDGIVSAWNATRQPPKQVRPGDFIFQVNMVFGDTVAMIQEMKIKSQLTIHVLRRIGNDTLQSPSTLEVVPAVPGQPNGTAGDVEPTGSKAANGESPDRPDGVSPGEALLAELNALGDEALGGLICVALERRPWLRAAVLAPHDPLQEIEAIQDKGATGSEGAAGPAKDVKGASQEPVPNGGKAK